MNYIKAVCNNCNQYSFAPLFVEVSYFPLHDLHFVIISTEIDFPVHLAARECNTCAATYSQLSDVEASHNHLPDSLWKNVSLF